MLSFSEKVEHLVYFFLGGCLVDVDVAYVAEEGEVDAACGVFLVVGHVGVQFLVVMAGDGQGAVVLLDVSDGLAHGVGGESCLGAGEVELADESPGDSVAVEAGGAAECPAFEGVSCCVSEVECFADAVLVGVLGYDVLFDGDAVADQLAELAVVGVVEVEVEQLGEPFASLGGCVAWGYECVLEHFGVA